MRSRSAPAQQAERQLVAVVAADIAGYSRLMGADEEGTLARLKVCRRDLIDPGIARHRGRIVKTTGDGLLIEFSSPVEAVRWSVEMQQGMIEHNADVPDDRRIEFRVGINLGDVIVDGRDLFGDAVNVAARLETLADPGSICISRSVREQIRDRLPLPFVDGGEHQVKNIARPIRVYSLSAGAIASLPKTAPPALAAHTPTPSNRSVRLPAIALAGILIVVLALWWRWPAPQGPPATATAPAAVPRLSIVVLPFNNLSQDPQQQYFADAITEDLTTDLSRIEGSFVISRNTAFTYQNKPVNAKQIGRDLGVRYVLEGSIQRWGQQVRISAQLIDAESDVHIWAERFERDAGDLFALQNEITGRIALALNRAMISARAAEPTINPTAQDYIFRGRAAQIKPASPAVWAEAIGWFERALALEPHSAEAQSYMALVLTFRNLGGNSASEADIARAQDLAEQALAAFPHSQPAHYAKGQVLRAQGRYTEAIQEYEAVLALNRNSREALFALGVAKMFAGSIDESIPIEEQVIRLSPHDPGIGVVYAQIGRVHLLQSRTAEAIVWLEKARGANPTLSYIHAWLAAAYGLQGETERAAAALAEARRVGGTYRRISGTRGTFKWAAPKIRELVEATLLPGLRKAGVVEE